MEDRKSGPEGRRHGKDRRQHTDPNYRGVERRAGSRRSGPRRHTAE
jgi:hypothetical protein